MNNQERDQLAHFLKQLAEAKVSVKNAEAEALIREAVARQPDAAYLLVQRAMLLEQALNAAKNQIAQLQTGPGDGKNSFLGSNPWAQSIDSPQNPAAVPGMGSYQIPRSTAPLANVAGSGASSFLGNVATTAAGVVAGSFLFQGIESLLGHHHSGWEQPAGEHFSEQTTINNYYVSDSDDSLREEDSSAFSASDDGDDSSWV